MKKIISILLIFLLGCASNESDVSEQITSGFDAEFYIDSYEFRDGRLCNDQIVRIPLKLVKGNPSLIDGNTYIAPKRAVYEISIKVTAKYNSNSFNTSPFIGCDALIGYSVVIKTPDLRLAHFTICNEWTTVEYSNEILIEKDEVISALFTLSENFVGGRLCAFLDFDVKDCELKIKKIRDL